MEPLNPELYQALLALFGSVRVSNEGEGRRLSYAPDYAGGRPRLKAEVVQAGEEYAVNCPFCNDTRKRLYVNHAYGEYDPVTGSTNYHLFYCFNERCHLQPGMRDRLKQKIEVNAFWAGRARRQRQASAAAAAVEEAASIALPGGLIPVSDLPADHPAVRYLHERGFEPQELSQCWQVAYCEAAPDASPPVWQRLVIPVYRPPLLVNASAPEPDVLAGWQARTPGPPAEGAPKYLFAKGLRKSKLLYGLPQALASTGAVVVFEGPTDVWRLGTGGVALFGKSLSDEQCRLLRSHFHGRPLVIALDRDAQGEAEEARERLWRARWADEGDSRVLLLELPEGGNDPADLPRDRLWQAVEELLARPIAR